MSWKQRQTATCCQQFEDNYIGVCKGRSTWMLDCRKFDDPDCSKGLRTHIGRNPRIMRSIMESKNHHELHSRLYDAMSRFFSSKNIVIMICRSGRHRSVANAELWSNTLALRSRRQHSASLLFLSELDFWKNTCAGKCSECSKQSTRIFQTHYDRVRAECPRLASASDSVTEYWKRPRLENCSESSAGKASLKARFAVNSLDGEDHFLEKASDKCHACFTHCWEKRVIIWNA